jgi:putative membrane protein
MTRTQGDLASLSRFIFRAPSWYASVAFSLVIAALTGIAAFDSHFILEDAWQGIFFIGVPTVIASILTPYVDQRMGGQLTPNRASLLALFCEFVVVIILTISAVIAVLTSLGQQFVFDTLIAALASIFAIRLLVVIAISRRSLIISSIPASIQTVAAAALLFIYSGTMTYLEIGGPIIRSYFARPEQAPPALHTIGPMDFVILGIVCVFYAIASWLFIVTLDRPWQRSLGVSVLDFVRGFVGHIAEGTRELEDFFEQLGEEAIVPVTVLSFRCPEKDNGNRNGDGNGDDDIAEKARFVLPMIHPGPMGEIGGGNLPRRVARSSKGVGFPPHATAGHDFNLVTEREVDTIIESAERAYESIEYGTTATRSVHGHAGEASILGQAFGDSALLVGSYAPAFADDIEYSVGLSASAEARAGGLDTVMLADAHNSNNGLSGPDLGHVTPGSRRSFSMIQATGTVGEQLASADQYPIQLGIAWDRTDWTTYDGIGPLGIRVAVIETDDQRTAYILIDGNNMEPGLRDRIVESVTDPKQRVPIAADGSGSTTDENAIDMAEIMTTDTHVVNTVEADNQVGAALPHDDLIDLISRLTNEAVDDLEPVEAGMATERATVTVFGNDRTETLASHANAMTSMGGALAAAFILAVTAVSILIFFFA